MDGKRGTGTFQWNTGGWFGGQIGSTCWMLACVLMYVWKFPLLGAILLGCFAVTNFVGTALWAKRDRVDPYWAIQILLAVILLFTAVGMVAADWFGALEEFGRWGGGSRSPYLCLLMFPGLMIWFHFLNRAGKSTKTEGDL